MMIMLRAWPQSRPWVWWLVPGQLALVAGAGWQGWRSLDNAARSGLAAGGIAERCGPRRCSWRPAWRNRIFGETRLRIDARNTVDPLTGLSTPLIF